MSVINLTDAEWGLLEAIDAVGLGLDLPPWPREPDPELEVDSRETDEA